MGPPLQTSRGSSRGLWAGAACAVGIGSVWLASSCSLIDLDNLSGAGAGDASAPTGGGATASTSPAASTGGASAQSSASSGSGGGGNAGSFCDQQPQAVTLCKDFDDGQPFGFGFNGTEEPVAGQVALDGALVKSAPKSLSSTVLQGTQEFDTYAYVYRDFAGTTTSISMAFDVYLDSSVIVSSADIAGILVDCGGPDVHVVNLEMAADSARVEQARPVGTDASYTYDYVDTGLLAYPQANQWSHVEMTIYLAAPAHVAVKVDRTDAGDVPLFDTFVPGPLTLRLGVTYAPSLDADLVVHFDNLVVTVQ